MANDTAKNAPAAKVEPKAGSNGNGGTPELTLEEQMAAMEAEAAAIEAELNKRRAAIEAARDREAKRIMAERMVDIKSACLRAVTAIDSAEGSVTDMVATVLKAVDEAKGLIATVAKDTKVKSTRSGSGSGFTPTESPRGDVWDALLEIGPKVGTRAATKGLGLTVGEWTDALREAMGKDALSSGHVGNTLSNAVHNSGRSFTVNGVSILVEAHESGNGTRRVAWGPKSDAPAAETPDLGPSAPAEGDKPEGNTGK